MNQIYPKMMVYNKNVIPSMGGAEATNVQVNTYVRDISNICLEKEVCKTRQISGESYGLTVVNIPLFPSSNLQFS